MVLEVRKNNLGIQTAWGRGGGTWVILAIGRTVARVAITNQGSMIDAPKIPQEGFSGPRRRAFPR